MSPDYTTKLFTWGRMEKLFSHRSGQRWLDRLTRFSAVGENAAHGRCHFLRTEPDSAPNRPPRSPLHLVPAPDEEASGRRQPVCPLHLSEVRLPAHNQTRSKTNRPPTLAARKTGLRVLVKDVGQSLPVLRTDWSDLRTELRGTHVDNLQATGQRSSLLKLDHKLKRIAALHEQTALNPDTCLTDVQDLARRRERPALQTTGSAGLDAWCLSLEPHSPFPFRSIIPTAQPPPKKNAERNYRFSPIRARTCSMRARLTPKSPYPVLEADRKWIAFASSSKRNSTSSTNRSSRLVNS